MGRAEIPQDLRWGKGLGTAPGCLLLSQHVERVEPAVTVGRVQRHCGAPAPAAFLPP